LEKKNKPLLYYKYLIYKWRLVTVDLNPILSHNEHNPNVAGTAFGAKGR
jgi:hypothetical protein